MFKLIVNGIKKITQVVKKWMRSNKVTAVAEKVAEVRETVELYKEDPVEAAKKWIPMLEYKVLLVVLILFAIMYVVGLVAAVSGVFAWAVIGTVVLAIAGLLETIKNGEDVLNEDV